jgi:hypothetical protein
VSLVNTPFNGKVVLPSEGFGANATSFTNPAAIFKKVELASLATTSLALRALTSSTLRVTVMVLVMLFGVCWPTIPTVASTV